MENVNPAISSVSRLGISSGEVFLPVVSAQSLVDVLGEFIANNRVVVAHSHHKLR